MLLLFFQRVVIRLATKSTSISMDILSIVFSIVSFSVMPLNFQVFEAARVLLLIVCGIAFWL